MLLTHVVVLSLATALFAVTAYTLLLCSAELSVLERHVPRFGLAAATAAAVVIMLVCLRSLNFGVDTEAYVELFSHYCNGGRLSEVEGSFQAATLLLNGLMLGSCNTALLPATWIAAIVLPVFAFLASVRVRLFYITAFLLSIVGIELATNALRQGLSVGPMVLGVSLLHARSKSSRWAALPLAALAVMFHSSAVLFIAAYLMARLPWRSFLLATAAATWVTVSSLDAQIALPLASEFLYEIQKYAAHEDDEFWIRVLAFACVLAALIAPVLGQGKRTLMEMVALPQYAVALRLGVLCMPFLTLPYFGYRFIYGVYPMILFLSLLPAAAEPARLDRQALWLCFMNVIVLIAWSSGSSYMREVPFL